MDNMYSTSLPWGNREHVTICYNGEENCTYRRIEIRLLDLILTNMKRKGYDLEVKYGQPQRDR